MKKDSLKAAIIVSSITFGMGHIINLFNGSGMQLISNLLQVVYATAAGFMFVMIYYKSGSLLLCIASHGLFNALSAFSNEANATIEVQMISAILLAILTGGYALYLAISLKKNKEV
jgi:membrane protease YdiL (CAAX protease family)